EENDIGMADLNFPDQPFPESEGFGVRVVDPEDLDALFDPEQHYIAQRVPQRAGVLRRKVGIDDVLIFLGRVFRIAHRAVRPTPEPLRMLLYSGVIRRALNREVERDFDLKQAARRDQLTGIPHRASTG